MKHTYYLSLLMLLTSLVACEKESPIKAEPGKPRFEIKDSDDPVDHRIYDLYQKTGVQIVYKFDKRDYLWNLGAYTSNIPFDSLVYTTNREDLAAGLDYLDEALLSHYSDAFKTKYFPLRLFLADSLKNTVHDELIEATVGRDYLLIGNINAKVIRSSDAKSKATKRGILNALLWRFIHNNTLIEIPEEFFVPSKDYYSVFLKDEIKKTDPREYGFLAFGEYNTPTPEEDVQFFVDFITRSNREEREATLNNYGLVRSKFQILTTFLKKEYNVDLEKIGDTTQP